jgi:hypothetical protein
MPAAVDLRPLLLTFTTAAAANAAALAFYPAMNWRPGLRRTAWIGCTVVVALSPGAVPVRSVWRMAAGLVAVALLLKLYDLERAAARGLRLNFRSYLAYLPNWFWMVRRRPARCGPQPGDVGALSSNGAIGAAGIAAIIATRWVNWTGVPFLIEHAVKVGALVLTMIFASNALASAFRLCGSCGMVPMRNPLAAVTPADFWRRWNRPTQQFLHDYVFLAVNGPRQPLTATLATFIVSGLIHEWLFDLCAGRIAGWQMAYFTLHGLATVATAKVRPRGRARWMWTAATLAFAFATTLLLGRSLNAIVPFYSPRAGR